MKTVVINRTSNGDQGFAGTIDKLSEIYENIAVAEARKWLFEQLQRENLTTRDIYSFAVKQAQIRTENKEPDLATIKFAMKAKQRDIVTKLKTLHVEKDIKQSELLQSLNGRRFKHKKILKKMKIWATTLRQQKIELYKKKITHYGNKQTEIQQLSDTKKKGGLPIMHSA